MPQGKFSFSDIDQPSSAPASSGRFRLSDIDPEPPTPQTAPRTRAYVEARAEALKKDEDRANGLLEPGNVDLFKQPKVANADGTSSTVDSRSFTIDGREVLLPSVTPDGRHLQSDDDILAEYEKTGRHLGIFDTPERATAYAEQLHNDYAAGKYRTQPMHADGVTTAVKVTEPAVQENSTYRGSANGVTMPETVKVTPRPGERLSDIELPRETPSSEPPAEAAAPPSKLRLSPKGAETLKWNREGGFYATPYNDSGGLAIGYGMRTWKGKPVTRDLKVTQEEADAEFERQIAETYAPVVDDALKVPVTQDQYDALISVAYNRPASARALIEKLNRGERLVEADFQRSATVRGQPNAGLSGRRGGEYAAFAGGPPGPQSAPVVATPPVRTEAATPPTATPHAPVHAYGVTDPNSVKVTDPPAPPTAPPSALRMSRTGEGPSELRYTGADKDILEMTGGPQAVRGVTGFAEGVAKAPPSPLRPMRTGEGPIEPGYQPPLTPEIETATSDIIEGIFKLSTPVVAGSAVKYPAATALAIVKAVLAQKVGEKAAEWAGASPEGQRLTGDVAALLSGAVSAEGITSKLREDIRATADALRNDPTARLSIKVGPFEVGGRTPAEPTPEPPTPVGRSATPDATSGRRLSPKPPEALPPAPEGPSVPPQGSSLDLDAAVRDLATVPPNSPEALTAIAALRQSGLDDQAITELVRRARPEGRATPGPSAPPATTQDERNAAHIAETTTAPPVTKDLAAIDGGRALAARLAERRQTEGVSPTGDERRVTERRKYASTQVDLPAGVAREVMQLGKSIPDEDLAEDGREDKPHVTVKYGLHADDVEPVRALLKDEPPIRVTFGKTSFFPNGESGSGDVLKVDIDSPDLHRLNAKIAAALEHTDTHPDYKPHATIAYLKPGLGKKYEGDDSLEGQEVLLESLTFSGKDKTKVVIPLTGTRTRDEEPSGRFSPTDVDAAAPVKKSFADMTDEEAAAAVLAELDADEQPVTKSRDAAPRLPPLFVVDVTTGQAREAGGADGDLTRKEVLVERPKDGPIRILRTGDQVTPGDRSKITKGEWAKPEGDARPTEEEKVALSQLAAKANENAGVAREPGFTPHHEAAPPKIAYNTDRHSIEIKFPAKPDAAVLEKVKAAGYKWAKTTKVWYQKLERVANDRNRELRIVDRAKAAAQALVGQASAPSTSSETGPKSSQPIVTNTQPTGAAPALAPKQTLAPTSVAAPSNGGYDRDKAQTTFRNFKGALSRVLNAAMGAREAKMPPPAQIGRWKAVLAETEKFTTYYDNAPEPYPDSHHNWQVAKSDAESALRRLGVDPTEQENPAPKHGKRGGYVLNDIVFEQDNIVADIQHDTSDRPYPYSIRVFVGAQLTHEGTGGKTREEALAAAKKAFDYEVETQAHRATVPKRLGGTKVEDEGPKPPKLKTRQLNEGFAKALQPFKGSDGKWYFVDTRQPDFNTVQRLDKDGFPATIRGFYPGSGFYSDDIPDVTFTGSYDVQPGHKYPTSPTKAEWEAARGYSPKPLLKKPDTEPEESAEKSTDPIELMDAGDVESAYFYVGKNHEFPDTVDASELFEDAPPLTWVRAQPQDVVIGLLDAYGLLDGELPDDHAAVVNTLRRSALEASGQQTFTLEPHGPKLTISYGSTKVGSAPAPGDELQGLIADLKASLKKPTEPQFSRASLTAVPKPDDDPLIAKAKALYIERGADQSIARMAQALREVGITYPASSRSAKIAANDAVRRIMQQADEEHARTARLDPTAPQFSHGQPLFSKAQTDTHAAVVNAQLYDNLPTLALGGPIGRFDPSKIVILDTGFVLSPEQLQALFDKPGVRRATREALRVLATATEKALGDDAPSIERIGVLLTDDTHGLYLPNPQNTDRATILLNPFHHLLIGEETPDATAAAIYHTIGHELTHGKIAGHKESFTIALGQTFHTLGAKFEIQALSGLMEAYADPAHDTRIHVDVKAALDVYAESRGGRGAEIRARRRTRRDEAGPADQSGTARRPAERTGSDRSRASASVAVNPDTALRLVKILRVYLKTGMTDFPTIATRFQQDFGDGARALDRALEVAWRMQTGEHVSVADVLDQEQNGGEESPRGSDAPHGTGQLPERGGPAARPAGTADEGTLGTVPAESGEGPPLAGGGDLRNGDSGGVVAGGIRSDVGAGPESVDAPAASGGTLSGDALSPSGDLRDPGHAGSDYTLTPERIATIIGRGPMQRARDNLAAIQLAKQLRTERRYATATEQDTLAKYVGWGESAVADYLGDSERYDWRATEKTLWKEIQDSTSKDERAALKASSLNAHFTFDLYRPIWDVLRQAGFEWGRVLEPAVGTGHALGFMAPDVRANSIINAVELEPITAAIAQALYPSAHVQATGYEASRIARGTQDLIISNVPFGKYGVRDPHLKPYLTKSVHNYFFAKALDHVRRGGYIVFVTTRYTMDSPEATGVRKYLMDRAHFVGAVRLPSQAFDKSAKTEVVTDIVVLQRKAKDDEPSRNAELFIEAPKSDTLSSTTARWKRGKNISEEKNVYRSKWYDTHPDLILGVESNEGTMYGPGQYTVTASDPNITSDIRKGLAQVLPAGSYTPATTAVYDQQEPPLLAEGKFKVGEYRIVNGVVMRADRDGELHDVTPMRTEGDKKIPDKSAIERITGMVSIRDRLRDLVTAMRNPNADDATIKKGQKQLGKAYDTFVRQRGELNSVINKRLFKDDPESTNLLGLETIRPSAKEIVDRKGKKSLRVSYEVVGKSDIFTKRTIFAAREITKVETPKDALLASLGTRATIDWSYMARIYGGHTLPSTVADLQAKLKAEGLVFEQPDGSWVLAEEYLSGDVVSKLADVTAAALEDAARFEPNVKALAAIQPRPKTADEITVTLGAHWVDVNAMRQFAAAELDVPLGEIIELKPVGGMETFLRWSTTFGDRAGRAAATHNLAVKYGPHERYTYTFTELLTDTLNLNTPSLGWWEGSGEDRHFVKDPVGTEAARANVEELKSRWQQWLYSNRDVMAEHVAVYNERFNRTVPRSFDGSHLANIVKWNSETKTGERTTSLPGLALPFPLHPHQTNAIWRMITAGNTLLAHEVGAGKTFEMIIAAMELRRTGRAQKPLITVPTYLLAQWRAAILEAYPAAKILAFEETDLAKSKRQQAMARIAFGDWDIVLVPHSSFQLLKISDQRMIAVMQRWVDELMDAQQEAKADDDEDSVKKLAAARKRFEDKIAKKLEGVNKGTDNALTWEDLGVDMLFVDEAHAFKNLYFFSKIQNLRGLSKSESDRSLDLYVKVQDINENSHHRNLVLATATPVMNSMAEIFTMQRYLQPQALEHMGIENFDNWYATFAQALPTTEQRPDGTYQEVMRLRAFQNLDLLYRTVSSVMDYVGWEDMPYLKLPKLKGGKVTIIQTQPHPMYPDLKKWFASRLAALREMPPHMKYHHDGTKEYIAPERMDPLTGRPMGKKDNILTVMTDAQLAAVDVRLVLGDRAKDFAGSRIQVAADKLVALYKEEAPRKGVQLIFLDVGTPKAEQLGPLEFLEGKTISDETDGAALGVEDDVLDDEEQVAEPDNANGVFNLYDALKQALIKRGVPSKQIVYIHQARNAAERFALFQAANEGKVRFVFASTEKGGVGMNIQARLSHVAHLDAPRAKRPGDIRQRDGRGIRQGNTYDEIDISRFVTVGSTDEWQYGMLSQKSDQITKFMRGDATDMKDDDPSTMSIEEAQIRATGDKRGIELIELKASMSKLRAQATAADRAIGNARHDVQTYTQSQAHNERDLAELDAWLKGTHRSLKGDDFSIEVAGTTYAKRGDANARLVARLEQVYHSEPEDAVVVGHVGGLELSATYYASNRYNKDAHVSLDINGKPYGGNVHTLARIAEPEKGDTGGFGAGRDLIASITGFYHQIPSDRHDYLNAIERAKDTIARSNKLLANPPDTIARLQKVAQRVTALEAELKAEGEARDKAIGEERQAAKAELAKRSPSSGGGTEASTGGYSTTTAPRTGRAPSRTIHPVEFPELVELAKELIATPQVVKRFRKDGKAGDFNSGTGQTRLHAALFKQGMEHELAATLAHELGHLIDWLPEKSLKRGNILGRLFTLREFLKHTYTNDFGDDVKLKAIRTELRALSAAWRPWDEDKASATFKTYRNSSKELYADALSAILNDPGWVEEQAPTFYKNFFEHLDRKPEVAIAYFEAQDLLSGTREELLERRRERLRNGFRDGTLKSFELQKRKELLRKEAYQDLGMKMRQLLFDINAPMRDLVADVQANRDLPEDENPLYLLSERNYVGGRQKAFLEKHVQPIYHAIIDAGITWEDFGEALFNSRVVAGDRSDIANPHGLQPSSAQELQGSLAKRMGKTAWATVEKAMLDFRTVAKQIAEESYDEGLYTESLHETIQENEAYAPFQVVEHMDKEVTWTVKQQIGTLKAVANPADTFTLKLLSTIRAIERNKMTRTAVEFLTKHFADEIEPAKTRWTGKTHEPMPPQDSTVGLITYYEGGKRIGFYVDQYIAKSINRASIGQNRAAMVILNVFTAAPFFRPFFTTFRPGFQAFNVRRDFRRFYRNVPGMTLWQALKLYKEAAPVARLRAFGTPEGYRPGQNPKIDEARERLIAAENAQILGVTYNDLTLGSDTAPEAYVETIFAQSGIRDIEDAPKSKLRQVPIVKQALAVLDLIRNVGDFIETLPKVAAIDYFRGGRPIEELTPSQRAFIREMVGSPDFLAGGEWTAALNKVFLYSNAAAQGYSSDFRLARHPSQVPPTPASGGGAPPGPPPGSGGPPPPAGTASSGDWQGWDRRPSGFWWKMASTVFLPKLLMKLALLGVFGAIAQRILQRGSSEYDRTNYLVIPLGEDGPNGVVLRVPDDETNRFFGALFWKALGAVTGDKDVWSTLQQVMTYMGGQLPSASPGLGAMKDVYQYSTGQNPYDEFRGRAVLSDDEQRARRVNPVPAAKKFIGWEFQELGGGLVWKFYAGEDRPEQRTKTQVFLDTPILSDIVGRFFKSTNYGEIEAAREVKRDVEAGEANRRIGERSSVSAAIRELQSMPPPMREARALKLAKDISAQVKAQGGSDTTNEVLKKLKMGLARGTQDPLADIVLSGGSNAQKTAALLKAAENMAPKEFDAWLERARQESVLSSPLYGEIRKARQATAVH